VSAPPPAHLDFIFDGGRLEIQLDHHSAPRTIEALLACLPFRFDLHCAKIAGSQILWHAPFVCDAEGARDILSAPPGAFIYWPERQFLELIYAPLQAESAEISVLGHVRGGIDLLRALGDRVRARQGLEQIWATLVAPADGRPARQPAPIPDWLATLAGYRRAIWQAPPPGIAELLARRGVMLPLGPLLMAENDARKLHELAWRFLREARRGDAPAAAWAMRGVIDNAEAQLVGLCGLSDAAPALAEARTLLARFPGEAAPVLEELVRFAGRLAAWLDLGIPWQRLSDAMISAVDEREGAAGAAGRPA